MSRILLLGAGHTHIEIALRAAELTRAGHELILISPQPEHPYSGMGPGMLGGTYSLSQILLPAAALVERGGGRFIRATAQRHRPETRTLELSDGRRLGYDVLSINTGSEPLQRAAPGSHAGHGSTSERLLFPVKPIVYLADARAAIEHRCAEYGRCSVAVIGGGAAGVELAANAAWLLRRLRVLAGPVELYSAHEGLAGLSGARLRYVRRRLAAAGVRLHGGRRIEPQELDADVVLLAGGIRPPQVLQQFDLPLSPDGALRVDRYLRVQGNRRVFAVGDSAYFEEQPLDRVGVYAVRMQRVLLHNLKAAAAADGNPRRADLMGFTATGFYLGGLNLGFGRAILYRGRPTVRGRPAFMIKDGIDRKFVSRYQQR